MILAMWQEALADPQAVSVSHQINPAGWLFLLLSVGSVVGLTWWCFRRVLAAPPEKGVPVGLGP